MAAMCFRAFLVMDNKVARQAMAENGRNGRKWQKIDFRGKMEENGFPRVSRRGHRGGPVDNGRKWQKWSKMGCRGYLVGNGFPRVSRHSPTTLAYSKYGKVVETGLKRMKVKFANT